MKEVIIDVLIALALVVAGGLLVYRHMEHKLAASEAQTALANKATETVVAASKTAAAGGPSNRYCRNRRPACGSRTGPVQK